MRGGTFPFAASLGSQPLLPPFPGVGQPLPGAHGDVEDVEGGHDPKAVSGPLVLLQGPSLPPSPHCLGLTNHSLSICFRYLNTSQGSDRSFSTAVK